MLSKNVIINVCYFVWISLICLVGAAPVDKGGAGINGFLALVLWCVCIFIMIKIRPWLAILVSALIVVGVELANSGMTWHEFWNKIVMIWNIFFEKIAVPLGAVIEELLEHIK